MRWPVQNKPKYQHFLTVYFFPGDQSKKSPCRFWFNLLVVSFSLIQVGWNMYKILKIGDFFIRYMPKYIKFIQDKFFFSNFLSIKFSKTVAILITTTLMWCGWKAITQCLLVLVPRKIVLNLKPLCCMMTWFLYYIHVSIFSCFWSSSCFLCICPSSYLFSKPSEV